MDGEDLSPTSDERGLTQDDMRTSESGNGPEIQDKSPTEASDGFLTKWADKLNIDEWTRRIDSVAMIAGPLSAGITALVGNPEAAMYVGTISALNNVKILLGRSRG